MDDPATPTRRHGGSAPRRWRRAVRLAAVPVLLLVVGATVLVVRYAPVAADATGARTALERAAERVTSAGLDVDASLLAAVRSDLAEAQGHLDRLAAISGDDPLVGLARALPQTRGQVLGADALVAAGNDLVAGGSAGVEIAERYLELRAQQARGEGGSTLAAFSLLLADSRGPASELRDRLAAAEAQLAAMPDGLAPPLEEARDRLRSRLATYRPLLEAYVRAAAILPQTLGEGGSRRYLVLAQDPAELRPTGGFAGTYGIVGVDDGELTERTFRDVYTLDLRPGLPYVAPPAPLRDHLLGRYSWQLADANWWSDFPTSAAEAKRIYELESSDADTDGVIALTTYAIDELLRVTGPIAVPEYATTVSAGETTLRSLALTRATPEQPGPERKAFLDVFAGHLIDGLLALPPDRWPRLLEGLQQIRDGRQAMVWLAEPSLQELVVDAGWDGSVRQDAGDFLYVVDSNVAPTSKLNLLVERSLDVEIALDETGHAQTQMRVDWHNRYLDGTSEADEALRQIEPLRVYGVFCRTLVPAASRFDGLSGGSFVQLSNPELQAVESGRAVFGSYLMVPPGRTSMRLRWTVPYVVEVDEDVATYRLTVQKQPGTLADPLRVRVVLPPGASLLGASPEAVVAGDSVTLETRLERDVELTVRYRSAALGGTLEGRRYTAVSTP